MREICCSGVDGTACKGFSQVSLDEQEVSPSSGMMRYIRDVVTGSGAGQVLAAESTFAGGEDFDRHVRALQLLADVRFERANSPDGYAPASGRELRCDNDWGAAESEARARRAVIYTAARLLGRGCDTAAEWYRFVVDRDCQDAIEAEAAAVEEVRALYRLRSVA